MILTCPECATRYSANASAIGPNGRTVRCANCSATWFVSADPEVLQLSDAKQAEAVAVTSPAPAEAPRASATSPEVAAPAGSMAAAAVRDKADREKSRRRLMGVSMVWVVTLVLLALMALAAYLLRHQIVERFPAAATLYETVGIEVKLGGITFENIKPDPAMIDGTPTLIINGRLLNRDGDTRPVLPVRFSLHNSGNDVLAEWLMDPPTASLPSKASTDFVTQYPNPPIDATILKYRFDDGSPLASQSGNIDTPGQDSALTTAQVTNGKPTPN